jgi:sulfide:quinone oxidoreductase
MYLACDYWRKKAYWINVMFIIYLGASIFGVPEYAETLKSITKYKIHTHFGANVTAIDGTAKQ